MAIKKYLKYIIAFIIGFSFIGTSLLPSQAYADYDVCADGNAADYVKQAQGCGGNYKEDTFSTVLINILDAVIGAASLVAVVFIVIGGINYMTSAGDTQKTEKGKKTIIYALIGLVICALAFAIVNWVVAGVLNQSDGGGNNGKKSSYISTQLPIA